MAHTPQHGISSRLTYQVTGGREIESYKRRFIELLVEHEAIRFGDFTLKSGRRSPYFINAGQLRSGSAIAGLGRAYSERILDAQIDCDTVFGPSYKGVPLAVATAMALFERGRDVQFCFDRKEAKDHGEGGVFIGAAPEDGMRFIIVDDVITSGRSIREAFELLRSAANPKMMGVVVAVDREERGEESGDRTTLAELEARLKIPVLPVVTIREIVGHLAEHPVRGRVVVDEDGRATVEAYLAEHGPIREREGNP